MPLCPKCGSEVAATDTHCMDCGEDLIAAREKERELLRETSMAARTGTAGGAAAPPRNAAAAGMASAGEKSSDETRLRVFDKQEAERLTQERTTAWVTAGIALLVGLALAIIGVMRVKAGGGFGEIPGAFKPEVLRSGGLFSVTVLGVMVLGSGVSGLLVGIGQVRLAMAAGRAIVDVKRNVKPEIAQVSTFTRIGMFLLCIFCPPLGFIIGLIMLFGRNPDLKGLGGTMAWVSLGIMALVGLNMLWTVFENMKPTKAPSAGAK